MGGMRMTPAYRFLTSMPGDMSFIDTSATFKALKDENGASGGVSLNPQFEYDGRSLTAGSYQATPSMTTVGSNEATGGMPQPSKLDPASSAWIPAANVVAFNQLQGINFKGGLTATSQASICNVVSAGRQAQQSTDTNGLAGVSPTGMPVSSQSAISSPPYAPQDIAGAPQMQMASQGQAVMGYQYPFLPYGQHFFGQFPVQPYATQNNIVPSAGVSAMNGLTGSGSVTAGPSQPSLSTNRSPESQNLTSQHPASPSQQELIAQIDNVCRQAQAPQQRRGSTPQEFYDWMAQQSANSEPRNYAPLTAGYQAMNIPPPKFDLAAGGRLPLVRSVGTSDTSPAKSSSVTSQSMSQPSHGHPGAHHVGSVSPGEHVTHKHLSPVSLGKNIGEASPLSLVPKAAPMQQYQHVAPAQCMLSTAVMSSQEGYNPSLAAADPKAQRSDKLNVLTGTPSGLPTLAIAMDPQHFPFVEGARQMAVKNYGVVKLKNIPFSTKRSEVIAFLGRNSKILNDSEEPVHIIMERVTSKTMDAYVEFTTLEDAMRAVERHQNNQRDGRLSRLGDRPVEVELSSQASLMKDLFPLATGLIWDGASPEFKPHNWDEPWENFKGFVSEEEMTMLVKHVEVPHRSPFSKECPQRPYECLISTLKKFPWYVTERITISQRRAVYRATCELLRLLANSVRKGDDSINLSEQLYRRVTESAMSCPGFTSLMKDDVAYMTNMSDMEQRAFGQPRFANSWRHQYAIAPKPGIPLDVLEWYLAIIREQSRRDILARPLKERSEIQEKTEKTDMYWGYFWAEVGYTMGPQFDKMTLAQAAHAELSAVERILGRVFAAN
ncbi:hypothetical protein S40288_02022 [Stachybotrys chartarum IBT 40288]|nr:hypothetical protein S40288_02022 [Stachybotrys chartarum IBT 40288]